MVPSTVKYLNLPVQMVPRIQSFAIIATPSTFAIYRSLELKVIEN